MAEMEGETLANGQGVAALADRGVFVLPGSIMNAQDYFRISLTASDEMVARALPALARVC